MKRRDIYHLLCCLALILRASTPSCRFTTDGEEPWSASWWARRLLILRVASWIRSRLAAERSATKSLVRGEHFDCNDWMVVLGRTLPKRADRRSKTVEEGITLVGQDIASKASSTER